MAIVTRSLDAYREVKLAEQIDAEEQVDAEKLFDREREAEEASSEMCDREDEGH